VSSQTAAERDTAGAVAGLFNGAVVSSAICAADEAGLLRLVHQRGHVGVGDAQAALAVHPVALDAVLRALESAAVVTVTDGAIGPGALFDQVWRDRGYFHWLMRGYGRMLSQAGALMGNGYDAAEVRATRDAGAVAAAGRDYGGQYVDGVFDALVRRVGFRHALDLGCGSGARLVHLARAHPGCGFTGVDVDAAAVRVATATVAEAGLSDRIELRCADAADLPADDRLRRVDLVFSFFMGHDFWPYADVVKTLTSLAEALPRAERFLLADTCRRQQPADRAWPVFSLGFDYTHGLMRQCLPTLDEWRAMLADTPWQLAGVHELGIADSYVMELTRQPSTP
jgi:phenylpyruvate C(3)-methyltransferase